MARRVGRVDFESWLEPSLALMHQSRTRSMGVDIRDADALGAVARAGL